MKLEVTRTTQQKETIEIEFPYYYKHNLMLDESDSIIYGKIEEKKCTSIQISYSYRDHETSFKLEIQTGPCVLSDNNCYMTDKYKSTEAEYLEAKTKLLAAAETA